MSQFIQDLTAATALFNQGMTQLAENRAYSDAASQLNDINQNVQDEFTRRQKQLNVAKQLGLNLLQAGAPVSQATAAAAFTSPEPVKTPDQLISQGVQFGRKQDVSKGVEAKLQQQLPAMNKQIQQQNFQRNLTILKAHLDQQTALMKSLQKGAGSSGLHPIPSGQLTALQQKNIALNHGLEIFKSVNGLSSLASKIGPLAGTDYPLRKKFDAQWAVFTSRLGRYFDKYRKQITGAQASDKEMQTLLERFPDPRQRIEAFKAVLGDLIQTNVRDQMSGIDTLYRTHYDTGSLPTQLNQYRQSLMGNLAPNQYEFVQRFRRQLKNEGDSKGRAYDMEVISRIQQAFQRPNNPKARAYIKQLAESMGVDPSSLWGNKYVP